MSEKCIDCINYDKCTIVNLILKEAKNRLCDIYNEVSDCFKQKLSRADHIRAMTDEELAELFEWLTYDSIEKHKREWLDWLKQPKEVQDDTKRKAD